MVHMRETASQKIHV